MRLNANPVQPIAGAYRRRHESFPIMRDVLGGSRNQVLMELLEESST